jgi:zinc transport system ATP-binding protein
MLNSTVFPDRAARPALDTSALVVARGLGVRRDGRWLIEGINLSVGRGEIVTLIGPNGGGKTTTVKALLGLINLDAGKVERAPGLKVGYVPQRFEIDWTLPLSVSRLMTLAGRHEPQAVQTALQRVGAEHLEMAEIRHLSGGEFQRVLLARAIIAKPDLLVLDEPVQGVDYSGEIELYELINALRDEFRCGILMISHDLHIVMAGTDTVVCLNGHVCCSGTPRHVAGTSEYQRLFGQRGASALAIYHHEHDHAHDQCGNVVALDEHVHHPDHGHDACRGPEGHGTEIRSTYGERLSDVGPAQEVSHPKRGNRDA